MFVIRLIQAVLAVYVAVWTLYVVALPIIAGARRRKTVVPAGAEATPSLVIIVPAHDMAGYIVQCIDALRSTSFPRERLEIYVVADHCGDETSRLAEQAGAKVLIRDAGAPGKTYALAWALEELARAGSHPDLYIITDATAQVEPGFLDALIAGWRSGENIVVGHSLVDTANQRWFAKCLGLTLVHRNLQNWARERLGLSCLIEGRGMAFSRRYIREYGWTLANPDGPESELHPTEDWRHGVRVVEHGLRVSYAYNARILTPLRDTLAAATKQGIRWERGRMANAAAHGVRLLVKALRMRNRLMIFASLDAVQPPVAVLGVLAVASAGLAAAAPASGFFQALGFGALVLVLGYGLTVTMRGTREGIPPMTVVWAPLYLLWRMFAFLAAWTSLDRISTRIRSRS